jgi:hypothetical protein
VADLVRFDKEAAELGQVTADVAFSAGESAS